MNLLVHCTMEEAMSEFETARNWTQDRAAERTGDHIESLDHNDGIQPRTNRITDRRRRDRTGPPGFGYYPDRRRLNRLHLHGGAQMGAT